MHLVAALLHVLLHFDALFHQMFLAFTHSNVCLDDLSRARINLDGVAVSDVQLSWDKL